MGPPNARKPAHPIWMAGFSGCYGEIPAIQILVGLALQALLEVADENLGADVPQHGRRILGGALGSCQAAVSIWEHPKSLPGVFEGDSGSVGIGLESVRRRPRLPWPGRG